MKKTMICIACPNGCRLEAECEGGKLVSVAGNKCPRGADYARAETEAPARVLTTCVLTRGLDIKMLPVRSSGPIPRERIVEAVEAVKRLTVTSPVKCGAVVASDFLGLGVDLLACRKANPAV